MIRNKDVGPEKPGDIVAGQGFEIVQGGGTGISRITRIVASVHRDLDVACTMQDQCWCGEWVPIAFYGRAEAVEGRCS